MSEELPRTLLDARDGKEYHLPADEGGEEGAALVSSLVAVANRRTGDFDPLFNSLDALDALFVFVKRRFPALLESGVLESIADLNAAVHDRVVGAKPQLFRRDGFDGSYRCREDYPQVAIPDPSASKALDRPQQTHANMMEGLTALAFEALRRGHGAKEASERMASMLREARIGLRDGKPGTGVDVRTARSWHQSVITAGRRPATGRAYTWKVLKKRFGAELAGCADPAKGRHLAATMLQHVRNHQSTDWYAPPRQRRSRRATQSEQAGHAS
ncbi:MAG: hypothetical protein ACRYHQ_11780 [Janthinobacterium lividum]